MSLYYYIYYYRPLLSQHLVLLWFRISLLFLCFFFCFLFIEDMLNISLYVVHRFYAQDGQSRIQDLSHRLDQVDPGVQDRH